MKRYFFQPLIISQTSLLVLSFLIFLFYTNQLKATISLPKTFGDHMVIQHDRPIELWGWADPGEAIYVKFNGKECHTKSDYAGNWKVILDPEPAGGPFDLLIKGDNTIRLIDLLLGDVWVCSGQSNMQWTINQTPYRELDTLLIKRNQIRLFTVHIDTDYMPRQDLKGGSWQSLSVENIHQFSAVAYHFGKYLETELDVPIGLISSNLGATSIETWMSNEALLAFDQFKPDVEPIVKAGKNFREVNQDFEENKQTWQNYYLKGPGIDADWYLPNTDISDWQEYTGPGIWEVNGLPNHDGAVWFRSTFDMPDNYESDSFYVALSQIDDYDITWINGVLVGETYGRHNHRNYTFPTSITKPKNNVIVIRAFDIGGNGGFSTNAFWTSALVRGKWKMKPGLKIDAKVFPKIPTVNVTPFSSPAVLFNANIAPLTKLKIKGVIWYQGESNVDRAFEYRDLFPTLIRDWRSAWKQPALPFLYVQLANYYPEDKSPNDSDWAELREAQTAALGLNHTGMATTIDIGEAGDIHPKNKIEVGKRLGIAAMKIAYGKHIIHNGPTYKSLQIIGNQVIIQYDHIGSGLMTRNKYGYVHGFAIAGADQKYHWAKAEIINDQVIVTCDAVPNPVAARYAWSNNPGELDLYNQEGLPAVPFRTDNWPLYTQHNQYDHTKARF